MGRIIFGVRIFAKEKYREDFLDGQLYMNPLGFFRKYEETESGNVGDPNEADILVIQPGQNTVTLNIQWPNGEKAEHTIPAEDFAAATTVQLERDNALNVLCLYAVNDRDLKSDSEEDFERFVNDQLLAEATYDLGRYAVIIVQSQEFQTRLLDAIRQTGDSAQCGMVTYYDPNTFHGRIPDELAAFHKRDTYVHQREYRLVWDRDVDTPEPATLAVPSLRDLCLTCNVEDVNDNLKDLLHQLRDQGVFTK
ncbi:MAG: hypothetical protein V7756_06190 [Halopseudomonas sp.]|uniref:hypothetical protein n=1 Tax=Halopseudomonas sp. TaxID=2901191 RepID=UPI0030010026